MKRSHTKNSISGMIFDICNVIFICIMIFVMVYPFWNQLALSLNEGLDARKGGIYFWPRKFTLENYSYIISEGEMLHGLLISILRVIVGTITTLFCSGLLAYITTVRWFSAHRFLRKLFIISFYFSGGMIPVYLLYSKLGLLESFTVYWLPGLFNTYFMMVLASYMTSLPEALSESARIDGCNELKIYFRIIMPLCVPVFAALAIMSAVGHWNSWFDVMIYNPSGRFDTLQMKLRNILLEVEQIQKMLKDGTTGDAAAMQRAQRLTPGSVRAATTMIVTLPIVAIYPFFQQYFVKGISVGAVKE